MAETRTNQARGALHNQVQKKTGLKCLRRVGIDLPTAERAPEKEMNSRRVKTGRWRAISVEGHCKTLRGEAGELVLAGSTQLLKGASTPEKDGGGGGTASYGCVPLVH